MNRKFAIAATSAALLAGTLWVSAQPQPQTGTPDPRPSAPSQKGEPKGAPKAAEPKAEPKTAPTAEPKAEPKAAPKAAEPKAEPKTAPKAAQPKAEPKAAPKAAEPKADPKAPQAGPTPQVTSEQRTRIRETIIKTGNAPRVTNVNFSLTVGTVVPRTVTVVVLPTTVVKIYPAWRGYKYFLVGDQIIIVEPDTLRIVMIIDA
jgi:hypothetical protein